MENAIRDIIKLIHFSCSYSASFDNNDNEALLQNLKLLQCCQDLSVFNPWSEQSTQFYSALHTILTDCWPDEVVTKNVLAVLRVAIKNTSARAAIVNTHNFIQPLSGLLENNLPKDQKIAVLNLVRDLSYRANVRQVTNLLKLIGSLCDIILANEDIDEVSISLGVMSNLCHKNNIAVYTLIQCVNIKTFLKTIVNLQEQSLQPEAKIQIHKLLLILDQFSGQDIPPDQQLLDFAKYCCSAVIKAFASGNASLMSNIVDFFVEAGENSRTKKVIATYPFYQEKLDRLLSELSDQEVPNNSECVCQLFAFVGEVVALNVVSTLPLSVRITQCAARWLTVYSVAPSALRLIAAVIRWTRQRDNDLHKDAVACVETNLQTLLVMLSEWVNEETYKVGLQDSIISLLQLFGALIAEPQLSTKIAGSLDKEEMKKLLLPVLSPEDTRNQIQYGDQGTAAVCIEVLSLMSKLSLDDKEWLYLYADLLQRKEIMKMFANALFSGCFEIKKKILYLAGTSSFSNDCLAELAKFLVDLNQVMPSVPFQKDDFERSVLGSQTGIDFPLSSSSFTSLTRKQTRGVDSLVEKFNDLVKNNQLEKASLAGIIELYQYKLVEMGRAELNLRAEGARLTQRTAQLSAETLRLYTLLHSHQTALDGSQTVVTGLREQIKQAHASLTDTQLKFKQLNQDSHSKAIIIKNQTEEIKKLRQTSEKYKNKLEDSEEAISRLKEESEELTKKKKELLAANSQLQENLESKEESLKDKEKLIDSYTTQITCQEQELADFRSKSEQLEKSLKDKEEKLVIQQNQLLELERIRKLINDISGDKKH